MNLRNITLIVSVSVWALAGCPRAGDDLASLFPAADPDLQGQGDDERSRRATAWLLADTDGDGLPK